MRQDDSPSSGSVESQVGLPSHGSGSTRRDFLLRSALAAAAPAVGMPTRLRRPAASITRITSFIIIGQIPINCVT